MLHYALIFVTHFSVGVFIAVACRAIAQKKY